MNALISDKYEAYKAECNQRFDQLKANEEELNRIFEGVKFSVSMGKILL